MSLGLWLFLFVPHLYGRVVVVVVKLKLFRVGLCLGETPEGRPTQRPAHQPVSNPRGQQLKGLGVCTYVGGRGRVGTLHDRRLPGHLDLLLEVLHPLERLHLGLAHAQDAVDHGTCSGGKQNCKRQLER